MAKPSVLIEKIVPLSNTSAGKTQKSKKKHKDGSSSQQDKSVDDEIKARSDDGGVEHTDKGHERNAISTERKKSKKKHNGSSSQQDKSVDDEIMACSDDGVEHADKGNKSNTISTERKKSKKKHKDGSSAQQDKSVDDEIKACSDDGGVEHVDKGNKRNATSTERKKSKKKHKDGSSAQQDKSVDDEIMARSDDGRVEHADKGNKRSPTSMERKKSKKKHKDGSSAQQDKPVDDEINTCSDDGVEHADKGNMRNDATFTERKKSKKKHKDGSSAQQDKSVDDEINACSDDGVEHAGKGNKRKAISTDSDPVERKKSKKKNKDGSSAQQDESEINAHSDDGVEHADKGSKRKAKKSKKKHKGASMQSPVVDETNACTDKEIEHANEGEKKKRKVAENSPSDATPNKSTKKVKFSGTDEVFTLPADSSIGSGEEDNLVRGKRFTEQEDEVLKQAVFHYIAKHNLGEEEGLDMVLNSKKHKEFRGCWREIGSQIPYRPYTACYYRAQVLFRRSKTRKWTQEEYDSVLKYQKEHGNKWKDLAEELGKHRWHVKDTYRRLQFCNLNKGHWSQQEYQKLFDLVNKDLQAKVFEEKHSKHGMLRDNIPWTAISEEVSTRTHASCSMKWYGQLTSRMVADGVWADVDDYVLISELYSLDANCIEDVDWDSILENRSGDFCRKRWNQMVLHIGHHGNKLFSEQVEILAQRYCPHLLEAREAWDNKPRVP